jgi:hypothetical protein
MLLALAEIARDDPPSLRERGCRCSRRGGHFARQEIGREIPRYHPIHGLPATAPESTPERDDRGKEPGRLWLDGPEQRLLAAQVLLGECPFS